MSDPESGTLPALAEFEDAGPPDDIACVRFENGARYCYRITDDGRAFEEVFHPDDADDDPTVRLDRSNFTTNSAAKHLVAILIEYEAYHDGDGHEQLGSDWGYPAIGEALAGIERSDQS